MLLLLGLLFLPAHPVSDREQSLEEPVWSFAAVRGKVGRAGLLTQPRPQGAEVLVSLDANFGGDGNADTWFVLGSTPLGLTTAWLSPLEEGLQQMRIGKPLSSASKHLVLLYGDSQAGEVRVLDLTTRATVATFPTMAQPLWLAIADLDFDGVDEVLVSGIGGLTIHRGSGTVIGSANLTLSDMVVAQLDADAPLEVSGSGLVVDLGTLSVQWILPTSVQASAAGDVDHDGMDELLVIDAAGALRCLDVNTRRLKWEQTGSVFSALHLTDLERNGAFEVIVADAVAAAVIVFDARTGQERFRIGIPGGTVTTIAAADLGTDGVAEILWTTDAFPAAQDGVYVADVATRSAVANSFDLRGPFVGAEFGDLDGDGSPELVTSCRGNAAPGGVRLLAFRWPSLDLIAVQDPFPGSTATNGIDDLQLADVDGDGDAEVVAALDWNDQARIVVFDFVGGAFSVSHFMQSPPSQAWFRSLDVADVDLDGRLEVVGGCGGVFWPQAGGRIVIYDALTGVEEWRSALAPNWYDAYHAVRAVELDGDPGMEICSVLLNESVRIFDGRTHILEAEFPGSFRTLTLELRSATPTILALENLGIYPSQIKALARRGNAYQVLGSVPCAVDAYLIEPGAIPGTAWTANHPAGFELLRIPSGATIWRSADFGSEFRTLRSPPGRRDLLMAAGAYGLMLFTLP